MIAQLVYHCLIVEHHGSHYDWHIWDYWYQFLNAHGYIPSPVPSSLARVMHLLAVRCGL